MLLCVRQPSLGASLQERSRETWKGRAQTQAHHRNGSRPGTLTLACKSLKRGWLKSERTSSGDGALRSREFLQHGLDDHLLGTLPTVTPLISLEEPPLLDAQPTWCVALASGYTAVGVTQAWPGRVLHNPVVVTYSRMEVDQAIPARKPACQRSGLTQRQHSRDEERQPRLGTAVEAPRSKGNLRGRHCGVVG